MSMTKGHVIKTSDIKEAIDNYVATQIAGYKEGNAGYVTFSTKKSLTNAVKQKYDDTARDKSDYRQGGTIRIDDVKDIMIQSMHQACRLVHVTYTVYENVGYKNIPNYTPPTHSYTCDGIYSEPTVKFEKYYNDFNGQFPKPHTIIYALDLTTILQKMIEYNKKNKADARRGLVNSCYSSCHASCHGSSRSRR